MFSSIVFLWWLNLNLLVMPRLFLYVDFFVPMFYVFIILVVRFLMLKFLFKELAYKFLVDYFAKNVIYKLKNLKYMDINLNKVGYLGFNLFNSFGYIFNYFISTFKYNSVVFLIFFIFLLLWGLNLSVKYMTCIHKI